MDISKQLRKAKKHLRDGDVEQAVDLYGQILRKYPGNIEAKKATQLIRQRNRKAPDTSELFDHYKKGNFEEAIKGCTLYLDQNESDLNIKNLLAASLVGAERIDEGIRIYREILSTIPSMDVLNNLSVAYFKKAEYQNSVNACNEVLKRNPLDRNALLNSSNALKKVSQFDKAKQALQTILKQDKNDVDALFNLANLERDLGNTNEAISLYRAVLKLKESSEVRINLCNILLKNNKLTDALNVMEEMIGTYESSADYLITLANVYKKLGRYENAISRYSQAIEKSEDHASAYLNRALSNIEIDLLDESIKDVERAIQIDPHYVKAHVALCSIYEKTNDRFRLDSAIKFSRKTLGYFSNSIKVFDVVRLYFDKSYKAAIEQAKTIQLSDIDELLKLKLLEYRVKAFDRLQQYEDVVRTTQDMNNLAENLSVFSEDRRSQYLNDKRAQLKTLRNFTSKLEKNENAETDQPCFLIGFPRSGTTLLDNVLHSHPAITVIEERPLAHSAIKVLGSQDSENYLDRFPSEQRRLQARNVYMELRDRYADNSSGGIYVDKLPLNIWRVLELNYMFPNAKYILSLRHPLDVILSNWMQNYRLNTAMSVMTNLKKIFEFYYLTMSYVHEAKEKLQLDLHEVRYENLIQNFDNEMSRLVEFLNVDWDAKIRDYRQTASARLIRTPSHSQVIQPLYQTSINKWRHYKNYLQPHVGEIEELIEKFGYTL